MSNRIGRGNYTKIISGCTYTVSEDAYAFTATAPVFNEARWADRPIAPANCVNCGAPAFPSDRQCSYCLTVHGER